MSRHGRNRTWHGFSAGSGSRSTDESTSVDRQREAIEGWARTHENTIVGWAIDEDVSGSQNPFETPELGSWLTDRLNEWDLLVSFTDADGNIVRRKPLASEELHARANRALDKGQRPTGVKNETALLIDVAKCACGASFYSHVGSTKRKSKSGEVKVWPYAYYRCSAKCGRNGIKMALLDEFADTILHEIGDIRRTERVQVIGADEQRISDLSVRIRDLSRELEEMGDEDPQISAGVSRLKRERKALKNAEPRWETVDLGEMYAEAWERMDKTERRALLGETGITITAELGKNGMSIASSVDEKTLAEKFRPTERFEDYCTSGAEDVA